MKERPFSEFIDNYMDSLRQVSADLVDVLYDGITDTPLTRQVEALIDQILIGSEKFNKNPQQVKRVKANVVAFLEHGDHAVLNGLEMRCGKTPISLLTAYCLGEILQQPQRVLIVCPPHLVTKWMGETTALFGDLVEVVNLNFKTARKKNIGVMQHLQRIRGKATRFEVYVIGLSTFREDGRKRHIKAKRGEYEQFLLRMKDAKKSTWWLDLPPDDDARIRLEKKLWSVLDKQRCPDCGAVLEDEHGRPLRLDGDSRKRCPNCQAALWQYDENERPRFYNPIQYIHKHLRRAFDLAIVDESHKLKAGNETGQGAAGLLLAQTTTRMIQLTGTPSDGKASNLWAMAWSICPQRMRKLGFRFSGEKEFIKRYGVLEEITSVPMKDGLVTNAKVTKRTREAPGIAGSFMTEIMLRHCIFGKLEEFFPNLPPYQEEVRMIPMSPEMEAEYLQFEATAREELGRMLRNHDKRGLGAFVRSILDCCENAYRGREMNFPNGEDAYFAPIGEEIQPKERDLIEFVQAAIADRRKVCVYVENTSTIDITPRVISVLKQEIPGADVRVLKDTSTSDRQERIDRWDREGMQVLITNPSRVEVGMDMPWATRVYYYQLPLSTFVLRQASKRGRGIYQTRDIQVVFAIYQHTMQAKQLGKQADKLKYGMLFDGLLPKGLALEADSGGDSLAFELARELVSGVKADEDVAAKWAAMTKFEQPVIDVPVVEVVSPVTQIEPDAQAIQEIVRGGFDAMVEHIEQQLPRGNIIGKNGTQFGLFDLTPKAPIDWSKIPPATIVKGKPVQLGLW